MSAAERKLNQLLAQVEKQFQGATRDPQDASAIHALRTSSRRFSQALVFFDAGTPQMRRRLKKLIRACGLVRDLDVIFEVLGAAHAGRSKTFRDALHEARKDAQKKMDQKLHKWRERDLFAGWKDSISPARETTGLEEEVVRLTTEFLAHGDRAARPGLSYDEIHRFRVLAKQLRYTLELIEPANSEKLKALKGLQDSLGALNDCVVTARIVPEIRAATPGIAGKVRSLLPARSRAFRAYWKKTFNTGERALWLKDYRSNGTVSTAARGS
jgi:CHAD domain-containing protein